MVVLSRIVAALLALILWVTMPLQANAQTEQRSYLTIEMLQQNIEDVVKNKANHRLEFNNLIIDFSSVDGEFSQQFYQEINKTIARKNSAIAIVFNNSVIQGDFQLDRLGISSTVGKAGLISLFTDSEREAIARYYPIDDSHNFSSPTINVFRGELQFNNTVFTGKVTTEDSLFLQPLTAKAAKFQDALKLNRSIFAQLIDFSDATFNQAFECKQSHFWQKTKFNQVEFQGVADFSNSVFEAVAEFNNSRFLELADFTRTAFLKTANFSNTRYSDRLVLAKSKFLDTLNFANTSFEKTVTLRDIYLNAAINLQDVHLLDRIDFSNAFFTPRAKINTSGLAFDSSDVKIIGTAGIGKIIDVNRLEGNETVLRNLIRNFRSLEQIADANNIEYQQEQLRAKQLSYKILNTPWRKIFTWSWISLIFQWASLNLLLLLGDYGTNIRLTLAIGTITISFFSYLFWLIDRYRPHINQPIIPRRDEIIWINSSSLALIIVSGLNIFITTDKPWLTLLAIAIVIVPLPILIVSSIYVWGRYHKLLDTTYFVEDGSFREFRLLIGRLPIMPRFPFYRDRYQPILWHTNWNWLNYYDFSLNNIFKLGFNDIRLRDRHLPATISILVWYQWCLGVIYIVLLLWTLSRTIPGLNLLIYF